PSAWVPACTLAEYVLDHGLYLRGRRSSVHPRLLDESHFSFRGGEIREADWRGPTERLTDTGIFPSP
ncbi:MAG TPA: hypothetical protein VIG08_02915, partial [Gemmatimonadales bacterium]